MSSTLSLVETLHSRLADTSVSATRFAAIVNRLYASGILLREESSAESRLYDEAQRIESLLGDYFELAGFRLHHNQRFRYFRLYPPAQAEEGEEGAGVRGLRHRLTKDFAAYVLGLRHLYQGAIDTGNINELAECTVPLADVTQAMRLLLRFEPPAAKSKRLTLYRELSVQKLVRLPADVQAEDDEMLLAIRPTILDFVTDSQLASAREKAAARAADERIEEESEPDLEPNE